MASRIRRALLAAIVATSVAVPVSGSAKSSSVLAPAPAAVSVAPLRSATPAALASRYARSRAEIRAAYLVAADRGDQVRARTLRTLAGPAYQFVSFDGRDGGRTVEVLGDLARAERIAVLVPGADTSLDTYRRFRARAVALQRELGEGSAVIAWLGYRTPGSTSLELLTTGAADRAAPALRQFVRDLAAARPGVPISLLGHSYGSVVCARAAAGLPLANVVLYGSPGTGYGSAAELRTRATVWAGRGADDWIRWLPDTTPGLGTDPVTSAFGARIFQAGNGGHSDYLVPGTRSLRSIAGIVRTGEP
jgi:Alpha/beta hydrolase